MAARKPERVLLRDNGFTNDAAKINALEILKQELGWSDADAAQKIRML